MGPLDAINHLLNLFVPALALAVVAAAAAKLIWRKELRTAPWLRLATAAAVANAGVVLAALIGFGADGKMAMYAGMVLASALTLWWLGFRRR